MNTNKINSFTDLLAWKKCHEYVLLVFTYFEKKPKYDSFKNQIERAAISITSNIAEGFGRQTTNDKKRFYIIARGSLFEVQNQLRLALDTNKITREEYNRLGVISTDATKLLHGLIRSTERKKLIPSS